ncbi:hypothetical protein OG937_02880 [Streptomyces sp. NBC_00510]
MRLGQIRGDRHHTGIAHTVLDGVAERLLKMRGGVVVVTFVQYRQAQRPRQVDLEPAHPVRADLPPGAQHWLVTANLIAAQRRHPARYAKLMPSTLT